MVPQAGGSKKDRDGLGRLSTAQEVLGDTDLSGTTFFVSGGNSGIGCAAAPQLPWQIHRRLTGVDYNIAAARLATYSTGAVYAAAVTVSFPVNRLRRVPARRSCRAHAWQVRNDQGTLAARRARAVYQPQLATGAAGCGASPA